ncbi:MAG: tetratricopeptide repeat protein, partial [Candidatus Baltobacteraceae bacterium]
GYDAACRAVGLYEGLDDRVGNARSLGVLAWALKQMGRQREAEDISFKALQLWRELGKSRTFEYAADLNSHATILSELGKSDEARVVAAEGFAVLESLGQEEAVATARMNFGELEFAAGRADIALSLATEAAKSLRRLQSFNRAAVALTNAAGYSLALGRIEDAREHAREVLSMARQSQIDSVVFAAQHLGTVAALGNQPEPAARLLGYANAWYAAAGYEREPTERRGFEILTSSLRAQRSDEAIAPLVAAGGLMSQGEAIDLALTVT